MSAASQFLSRTWDRDRIMAIVQFLPMALDGPIKATGNKELHESIMKLGSLADLYRTVTRCSGLIDMLNGDKVSQVLSVRDPTARKLTALEHFTNAAFFPFEHLALLNGFGVLKTANGSRFGGVAVFFWFWSLIFGEFRIIYQMLISFPQLSPKATDAASLKRQADWKKLVGSLVKTTCFLLFSLTCLPSKGKPQLLGNPTGLLMPLHKTIEILSPPHLPLSNSIRGILGLIASTVDFL